MRQQITGYDYEGYPIPAPRCRCLVCRADRFTLAALIAIAGGLFIVGLACLALRVFAGMP
jgi:hypothetical protein